MSFIESERLKHPLKHTTALIVHRKALMEKKIGTVNNNFR